MATANTGCAKYKTLKDNAVLGSIILDETTKSPKRSMGWLDQQYVDGGEWRRSTYGEKVPRPKTPLTSFMPN